MSYLRTLNQAEVSHAGASAERKQQNAITNTAKGRQERGEYGEL